MRIYWDISMYSKSYWVLFFVWKERVRHLCRNYLIWYRFGIRAWWWWWSVASMLLWRLVSNWGLGEVKWSTIKVNSRLFNSCRTLYFFQLLHWKALSFKARWGERWYKVWYKLEVLFPVGFYWHVTRDYCQTKYTILFSFYWHFIMERLTPQQRL